MCRALVIIARIDLLGQNSGFCIFGEGETANDISDDGFD